MSYPMLAWTFGAPGTDTTPVGYTFHIDANGSDEELTIYLSDAHRWNAASNEIGDALETAIKTHTQLTSCTVTLNADGTITIVCDDDFELSEGGGTVELEWFGFDGGTAYASSSNSLTSPWCVEHAWFTGHWFEASRPQQMHQQRGTQVMGRRPEYQALQTWTQTRELLLRFETVHPTRVLEYYNDKTDYIVTTTGDPNVHMENALMALWNGHRFYYHPDYSSSTAYGPFVLGREWYDQRLFCEVLNKGGPLFAVTYPLVGS